MDCSPYENVPTFSQVHGLQEIPGPPQLEEISKRGRNYLWGALWQQMQSDLRSDVTGHELGYPWRDVFASAHQGWMGKPLDEFTANLGTWRQQCRNILLKCPYNLCFDFLQTLLRHPKCPVGFVTEITEIFRYQLAYRIDTTSIPTIVPAATEQEGDALIGAIQDLDGGGLGGAATHLRQAGERIRDQDWAGSVRESIHAVESIAKRIAPGDADTLGEALAALEQQQGLHAALKRSFGALYGYTSDEQGIRHALLEDESRVTQDEAVYMIGACAAFCSYLWRKLGPQNASPPTEPTP